MNFSMKEQELSSKVLYFDGNSKYQKKSHAHAREKKLYYPRSVQRMAFY